MAPARHTPPGDASFISSLTQHLAAAVALVLVVAGGFWAVGQLDAGDDDVEVGAAPSPSVPATETPTEAPTTTSPTPDDPATKTPRSPEPSPSPSPEPEPSPTETSAERIDPSEVSIQVLDAVLDDGGAAANRVADELRGDGYNVIVVNDSFRTYDSTTVFFTDGHEAEARQLADEYGFARVEPKPSNLSSSVDIHLVVGRDRA